MNTTVGYIAAATAVIVWGLVVFIIKRIRSELYLGIAISMLSGFLGLVVVSALMNTQYPAWSELLSPTGLLLALAGIFQFPLATIAYYKSIRLCEVSVTAPMTRVKIAFLVLIVMMFGLEPIGWKLVLSAVLGVIGAITLMFQRPPVARQKDQQFFMGAMIALLASFFWALGDVFTMQVLKTLPALPTTVLSLTAGMLIYIAWLVLNGKLRRVWNIPVRDKLLFAAHGLLSFAIGYGSFYISIKHLGVTRASVIAAGWPLISFAAGLTVFRERISPAKIAGVLLIMSSVFLAVLK